MQTFNKLANLFPFQSIVKRSNGVDISPKNRQFETWSGKQLQNTRIFVIFSRFGGIFGFLSIFIAAILHYIAEPFSISSHWVSNLGAGPNGSSYFFNYGLMITSILLITAILLLRRVFLQFNPFSEPQKTRYLQASINITTLIGVIASTGIIILTIWDMFSIIELHSLGAYMYFVGSGVFTILFSILVEIVGIKNQFHRKFLIYWIGLNLLFAPVLLYSVNFQLYPNVGIFEITNDQWQSILSYMGPELGLVRAMEWIILISFFSWIFIVGYVINKAILKNK